MSFILIYFQIFISKYIPNIKRRDLNTKYIGVEVFGELWHVVLQGNGEDEMDRDSN